MTADILIEDDRWRSIGLADLADRATDAALAHLGLDPALCEVTLLACDDARIAALNAEFRDKPRATNVLSWPSADLAPEMHVNLMSVCRTKPSLPERRTMPAVDPERTRSVPFNQ